MVDLLKKLEVATGKQSDEERGVELGNLVLQLKRIIPLEDSSDV